LRLVPAELRRGATALGLSRLSVLLNILIPTALPGLIVGFVLGLGRAVSETAALLFTSGYVDRMPDSVFDSGRSLSVHIYDLSMNVPGGDANASRSALTLLFFVFVINALVAQLSEYWIKRKQAHDNA
jgi:phosphate transport system permease protein